MIKIPILDLKRQIVPIHTEIDAAVKRVIDSAHFILGEEVESFEKEVANYCNVKYAIGVSNGTDALRLALLSCGIKSGDGVICPAFTYFATAGAIASIGARPIFADIEPDTYNISVASIEKIIKQDRRHRIKAIIPVHLYGQCADMDSILRLAKKYKLKVVEDVAQAFGAQYKGRKAGTIGDCGAVSFFPGKNLGAFGDAGMVLTNNKIVAERIKILRNQGNKEKYHHIMLGHNNRLDNIQAAVLRVKLKYLDSWNRKRRENADYLNEQLQYLRIKTPNVADYTTHIYHQYVLRLENSRNRLFEYLRNKGIDCRIYYPAPLHLQKCFKNLHYKRSDFPESEKAASQALAIPVYPELSKTELDYIAASIKEFLR